MEDLCEIYDYDYMQSTIEAAQLEKKSNKNRFSLTDDDYDDDIEFIVYEL